MGTEGQNLMNLLETRSSGHVYLETPSGDCWTYAGLYREVGLRRRQLRDQGIKPGSRLAIEVRDPAQYILWHFAVMTLDAASVPLNPDAPLDDVRKTLVRAEATHWLSDSGNVEVVPQVQVHPAGAGVILLTSGSTGEPKPAGLSWLTMLYVARQVAHAHRFTEADRGLSPLPLFHINALVVAVLATLVAGGTLVLPDRFHARSFWNIVDTYGITWINGVPSILGVLIQRLEAPVHSDRIRFVRSASAPLSQSVRERFEARFRLAVVETYGMTEAASQIAANSLPGEGLRPGSVGLPRGVAVRVVGRDGNPRGAGERGAIEIKGPGVIDPSWGPNAWAQQSMRDGWYRTGDVGHFDADGYLYLDGRRSDVINRGGENIFPREVEERLMAYPAVEECAVVGRPHAILGEEPVAFVVPAGSGPISVEALSQWAADGLARFKRPVEYFVVDNLPKGRTGKVLRRDLEQRARSGSVF